MKNNHAPSDGSNVAGFRIGLFAYFLVAGAIGAHSVTGQESAAKPNRPRGPRGEIRNIVNQSARGVIAGLHRNTSSRNKPWEIDVQLENKVKMRLEILPSTQLDVQDVALDSDRVAALLAAGVPVDVEWIQSAGRDTPPVTALHVRTVKVEGVIKRIGGGRLVARAAITRAQNPSAPLMLPPNIPSTQPVPEPVRDVSFTLKPDLLSVTLNGRNADLRRLKDGCRFTATAMDGGPSILFVLDAATPRRGGHRRPDEKGR